MAGVQPAGGGAIPAGSTATADDVRLVEALRRGDEAAFGALVDRYQGSMVRLAWM